MASCVLGGHSPPYCFEAGSLTESGARLAASQPSTESPFISHSAGITGTLGPCLVSYISAGP